MIAIYFAAVFLFMKHIDLLEIFPENTQKKAIIVIDVLYCLLMICFLIIMEALNIGKRRLLDLSFGFFFGSVCVNVISAVILCIFIPVPFGRIVLYALCFIAFECFIGFVWILSSHRVYERVQFRKEAVYIYGSRDNKNEFKRINSTINKYFKISTAINYSKGMDHIMSQIEDSTVVYLGNIPTGDRNTILKYCMKRSIDCYSIPKISDIYIQNSRVMQLYDKLLLQYPPLEISRGQEILKRGMDIVFGTLLLVLSSPFMLAIAIAIKLTDHGPVLFKQKRVTKNGKEFVMYKFRSMKIDAEKGGARLAKKNDDRITSVGRVIRNIHFDELPQLINILKGEMSLVGPRPERMEFIEEYSRVIPEFPERLKVKAGLTGYAQIYGKYNTEPEDKIKFDLYYIYNYSFWMDIKLIILTIRILFQKENTEGVDDDQISALR